MQPVVSLISQGNANEFRSDASDSFSCGTKSTEFNIRSSLTTIQTPLVPQPRFSISPAWLKIDKLQLEALSLYGRDPELDTLNKCLDSISSGAVERQFILISGESGTGKTALARSLETPTTKLNGLFVKGKFDFNNRNDPYSGIVGSCVEICDHILSLQEQNLTLFRKVSQLIKDGLGSELSLLIKFIPSLKGVIDYKDEDPSSSLDCSSSSEEAKNRFHFTFQRFIRIISDEFGPLILLLDDLQWADGFTMDLLDVCLSDLWIKRLVIIGTYRSNEADHILRDAVKRFRIKSDMELFNMTQVSIENLDVNSVNKIIGVLLKMDDIGTTMGLAQVCFKKTQGNPFFVLQFLQMVHNSGLLKYDYGSFSWNWSDDEIYSSTNATSNVVDVLKTKMRNLPKHLLKILKIAACLGSTFNESHLRVILENSSTMQSFEEQGEENSLTIGLQSLEIDGYIVRCRNELPMLPSQSFSWTHDKIREAALMLIPTNERASFHRDAGDVLLSELGGGGGAEECSIFVVASLLNVGGELETNNQNRLTIARLNHDASVRALSISAFESAADYAGKGIKLLPENHWNDHYDLSLGLYSIAAQAEGFLGNTDRMEQYCTIVLSQRERPMKDKMWVYYTLVNSFMARGQVEEAADLAFNILEMCNCRFPKNPLLIKAGLIKRVFRIKSVMKAFNPETIEKSNNPMIIQLMQLMEKLAICLYLNKDARMPLVIFRMLDWSIMYGSSDYSSVAFASVAMILTGVLHDFSSGTWYGEQALKLMEKSQSSAKDSRTMFSVYAFIYTWTKPLTQLMKPLLNSYNEGMQSGDQDSAAYSIVFWLFLRYIVGNPLGNLEDDIWLYSSQMKDWKLRIQMAMTSSFHQAILNLMGRNDGNPLELVGEVFSEEDRQRCSEDYSISAVMTPWEGILLTYFGDHVRHANKTIQCGHDYLQKRYPASLYITFDTMMKGISCFAAARETGKLKYSRIAEKLRSKIKKWREMGNPNVTHYESFLDAESAAFHKKNRDAVNHYEITIRYAGRTGFLQDAAFACERLAQLHLTAMGNQDEAAYRINQSIMYWKEWGAIAKAEALETKYCHLLRSPISNPVMVSDNRM